MKVLVIFLLLFMVSLYVFIPTSFAESTYVCQEYDPEITVIPNKEIFYPQENMTLKIIGQPNKTTEIIIENPKTKLFSDTVKTDLTGNATFTYPFEQHPMKGTWKIIANQDANVDILFLGMYDKPQRVLTVHANALMHSKFHTATFTIAGNPEQMLDLDVVNPMKQTVFHDKLILDSNGMCVYSMPLEGLSAGVYDFAISDNLVFASASFAVGLQPYDSALETISEPTKHDVLRPEQNGLLASPLDQLENGIPYNEIQCKQNLILIQKYDGSPACVTESTKQKLIERGWTKDVDEQQSIPVIGHIKDFYHDVRKVESGKTFQIPLEYYPDGIPENLRFGVIGAEIPDARHEFIFNGIEKLPEGIEAEIDNTAMPPNLIITTKQGLSGEQIIGLIIVNDTNGTKELHQYQIRIEN